MKTAGITGKLYSPQLIPTSHHHYKCLLPAVDLKQIRGAQIIILSFLSIIEYLNLLYKIHKLGYVCPCRIFTQSHGIPCGVCLQF